MFNVRGNETTTAALSEVIPITSLDGAGASKRIKGEKKGSITDKGCSLKATFSNDGRFNKMRVFSIVYLDANEVPSIFILNEIDIPSSSSELMTLIYNDTGSAYISQITIDEFNAMIPFEFKAATIEKLNNRLFAANLQEITWDIPSTYDTRAYRCTYSKDLVLQDANGNNSIVGTLREDGQVLVNGSVYDVPASHDCVNPTNLDITDENPLKYIYGFDGNGSRIFGGSGPNISYRFIFT